MKTKQRAMKLSQIRRWIELCLREIIIYFSALIKTCIHCILIAWLPGKQSNGRFLVDEKKWKTVARGLWPWTTVSEGLPLYLGAAI
jgi:hypothetical protein